MREVSRYEMIKTINEGGDPKRVVQISTDDTTMVRAFMDYDDSNNLAMVEIDIELSEDDRISDVLHRIRKVIDNDNIEGYYDVIPYLPECDIVVAFVQSNSVYLITDDITIRELRQKYEYEDEIYLYLE